MHELSQDDAPSPSQDLKIDLRIKNPRIFFLYVSVLSFFFILIRNAWICDDAFITMRTIDNLTHGNGLTWNVGERVQTFTNPLWLFCLTLFYFIHQDPYFTLYVVSIVVSLVVVALMIAKLSPNYRMTILGFLLLTTSKAFMDFSTSGLENPLTHLLLITFIIVYLKNDMEQVRRSYFLSLLAALSTLNRLDTILFYLPVMIYEISTARLHRRQVVFAWIAGFAPLLLWELFSLLYYGFTLPNTYYAKIEIGITHYQFFEQGKKYFVNSLNWDPVTLPIVGLSILIAGLSKSKKGLLLLGGGVLYVIYVLSIGGDFMAGRFFSAIFVMSVALILNSNFWWKLKFNQNYVFVVALYLVLAIGLSAEYPPLKIKPEASFPVLIISNGVAEEKLFYYPQLGLVNYYKRQAPHEWGLAGEIARNGGERVILRPDVGSFGYYAGPDIYIMDDWALADPLRARLPAAFERVGHYRRGIPEGYLETIKNGFENQIRHPELAEYYDKLLLITHGEIFSSERIKTIIEFNLGKYDHLLDAFID